LENSAEITRQQSATRTMGLGIAQRKAVISTFATCAYVDVPAPFKELADIFA